MHHDDVTNCRTHLTFFARFQPILTMVDDAPRTVSPTLSPEWSDDGWKGDTHAPTMSPEWKDDGWKGDTHDPSQFTSAVSSRI